MILPCSSARLSLNNSLLQEAFAGLGWPGGQLLFWLLLVSVLSFVITMITLGCPCLCIYGFIRPRALMAVMGPDHCYLTMHLSPPSQGLSAPMTGARMQLSQLALFYC